ncbi:MAG: hypothetical protein ACM3PS_01570 [Syntrophothermus sp.]
MADIRCPKCGRDNPSSLTICQFCQAPLTPESTLRIGDKPIKKNTGELEPVLPDWLRDVRQQARDAAEKDAADAATMPKIQKAEPPDLLAGLASQVGNSDEEDVPDWLASLSPKPAEKKAPSPKPESDFFAQFNNEPGSKRETQSPEPPSQPVSPEPAAGRDELSEWFTKAAEQPAEPFSGEAEPGSIDLSWDFKEETSPREPSSQPGEDLSWLRNLEAESKKTGDLSAPKQAGDRSAPMNVPGGIGSSGKEDLSWLDNLGALPAEPSRSEPPGPGEDLSWLKAFSETPQSPQPGPTPPSSPDLNWLDDLGSLPPGDEPAGENTPSGEDLSWLNAFAESPAPSQNAAPPASQDDLGWLNDLGKDSRPVQPAETGEDLGWLRDLQGTSGTLADASEQNLPGEAAEPTEFPDPALLSPRHTAPLGDAADPSIPDWLKSAAEDPSLPLGPQALDQMRDDKTTSSLAGAAALSALFGGAMKSADETSVPSQPGESAADTGAPSPEEGSAPFFSEDVDAIFSQDLPDWLANAKPEAVQEAEDIGIHAEGGETLSPAELPAWVQAMRPVEAVISEAGPQLEDQPAERAGPLAGLKGVIPMAAIGSMRRPQPIPLTLQATADQQAGAGLLEQILLRETTPRPVVAAPEMASQRSLRWVIAGLMLFVLAAVIFSGTQIMPVSPVLPRAASDLPNVVMGIADNAPVLVILDYEPALAGEMEAVSGPLLDQLVRLHNPYLSFLATSPSGNALAERLLANTNLTRPDGTGYVAGQNYTNLGYLPGGEAGVLAFIQSPQSAVPASPVLGFSEYAAILLLTDHAESARTWVEQLYTMKQSDPALAGQPLIAISSAQTGPMLQPYFGSGQITGLISGLPVAARYEFLNGSRPGTARSYWDAFGAGMMMAVALIVIGSLWSLYSGTRERQPQAAKE